MPKIVDRTKGQTMFRYRQHEMSGPLPPLLYKYLPLQYAHALIEKGEVTLFGTSDTFCTNPLGVRVLFSVFV